MRSWRSVNRASYKTMSAPHPSWLLEFRLKGIVPKVPSRAHLTGFLRSMCIIWPLCGFIQLWAFPENEPLTARSRILSACLYVSEKGQTQTPWLRLLCWCKSFDTALMRGSALQLACSDGVQGSMNQKKWTMVSKTSFLTNEITVAQWSLKNC